MKGTISRVIFEVDFNGPFARSNQAMPTTLDPKGHRAFTYMPMYSVRAQSSRYIELSRSSNTIARSTTNSFPPLVLASIHLLYPLFSQLLSSHSVVYYSHCDIVIHYSILRHHEFPQDDLLIVYRTATRRSDPYSWSSKRSRSKRRRRAEWTFANGRVREKDGKKDDGEDCEEREREREREIE